MDICVLFSWNTSVASKESPVNMSWRLFRKYPQACDVRAVPQGITWMVPSPSPLHAQPNKCKVVVDINGACAARYCCPGDPRDSTLVKTSSHSDICCRGSGSTGAGTCFVKCSLQCCLCSKPTRGQHCDQAHKRVVKQ